MVGLFLLTILAHHARENASIEDYEQALEWAKQLLGVAGTLAGFLGVSTATVNWKTGLTDNDRAIYSLGGMVGILAGATLLNVGGWPIPAALAAIAIGTIAIRVRKNW